MTKKEISEQADAWMAVCSTLSEVMPGWANHPGNGIENAVAAIRKLAARDAQWNALIAGQAGEAVAWRYRFHTDDSLAGKPNVRGWVLTDIRPPTRSGDIEVEPLFAAPVAQPATEQAEAPSDTLRVACITLDGSTLYIPAKCITDFGIGDDDGETYALTFKTMTRAEYEALGEFDGF